MQCQMQRNQQFFAVIAHRNLLRKHQFADEILGISNISVCVWVNFFVIKLHFMAKQFFNFIYSYL